MVKILVQGMQKLTKRLGAHLLKVVRLENGRLVQLLILSN